MKGEKKREKEYEKDMTESLRLLRVSRAPAGDLVCSNKKTLRQVSESTTLSSESDTVTLANLNSSSKKKKFLILIIFKLRYRKKTKHNLVYFNFKLFLWVRVLID